MQHSSSKQVQFSGDVTPTSANQVTIRDTRGCKVGQPNQHGRVKPDGPVVQRHWVGVKDHGGYR